MNPIFMFLLQPKGFASGLLCLTVLLNVTQGQAVTEPKRARPNTQTTQADQATTLEFREFFEPGTQELKPSAKLLSLDGKRVRMTGFMAQMEQPPAGAFYLCPRPVYGDESGGGTADLPIANVRVIVRSAKDKAVPFVPRLIEVTGILEVGNRAEADGSVSSVRLLLDAPPDKPEMPQARKKSSGRKPIHSLRKGAKTTTPGKSGDQK